MVSSIGDFGAILDNNAACDFDVASPCPIGYDKSGSHFQRLIIDDSVPIADLRRGQMVIDHRRDVINAERHANRPIIPVVVAAIGHVHVIPIGIQPIHAADDIRQQCGVIA
ncbi:hypothetical protein D3C85_1450140 [compost metagenome]